MHCNPGSLSRAAIAFPGNHLGLGTNGGARMPPVGTLRNMGNKDAHDQRRSELIEQAAEAAARRLDNAGGDAATAYAATGELLMWLIAADDALQGHPIGGEAYKAWRRESPDRRFLLLGLRYVRNRVIHESRAWEQKFEGIYTERYYGHYGAWVWMELPPPQKERHNEQFEAYNARVRGRAVLDTALEALDELRDWWGQGATL